MIELYYVGILKTSAAVVFFLQSVCTYCVLYAGIMEVKGAKVEVQEGFPQLVWHSSGNIPPTNKSSSSSTSSSSALISSSDAKSEDQVMHYIVKVDR